ncbi:MAG: zinc-binding dehydrogenase, partial [Mycetocola sp.]
RASGLCHSDLHLVENDFGFVMPAVFGHEISGVALEVGPRVTSVAVGDHVVGCLIKFCGSCIQCTSGRTFGCSTPDATLRSPAEAPRIRLASGLPLTQIHGLGGFAEQALVHENQLAVVNNEIPFAQAALLGCAVATGAGAAINTAGVRVGDSVAVVGTGGVGLNAISGSRLAGAKTIIAVDNNETKLAIAHRFGATHIVNSARVDAVHAVREITNGGVDHAFEAVGLTSTLEQALGMRCRGGGAYFIGIAVAGTTVSVDASVAALSNRSSMQGVALGSTNLKRDLPLYADLYIDGRLNLDDLISQTISIEEIEIAYDALKNGEVVRSVVTF